MLTADGRAWVVGHCYARRVAIEPIRPRKIKPSEDSTTEEYEEAGWKKKVGYCRDTSLPSLNWVEWEAQLSLQRVSSDLNRTC